MIIHDRLVTRNRMPPDDSKHSMVAAGDDGHSLHVDHKLQSQHKRSQLHSVKCGRCCRLDKLAAE